MIAGLGTDVLLGEIIGPAGAAIVIDKVVANGLVGLEINGTYLLDPANGTPIATASEIPAAELIWIEREPAVGATLQAGDVRNVILGATVAATVAKIDSLTVYYSVDGESASAETLRSYEVANECL